MQQIVPAQREFAAKHAERRAKMLAAAVNSENRRLNAERVAREALQESARRAAEIKRMEKDRLLIAIERAMEAHRTDTAIETSGPHQPSTREVMRTIARGHDITWLDITSERRVRYFVRPRQLAMFIVWSLTNKSLPKIGQEFGGRDHTTVLHAVRKISTEFGFNYPADRLKAYDKAKEILIAAGYVWPADNAGRGY